MIGLILLYFIGKHFFYLAGDYDKSRWLFAILGVLSYYLGSFIGGVLVVLIWEMISPGTVDQTEDIVLGLLAAPFGILLCWGFYHLLKRTWEKSYVEKEDLLEEFGKEEIEG